MAETQTHKKRTKTSQAARTTTGTVVETMTAIGEAMMAEARAAAVESISMIGAEVRLVALASSLT